VTKSRLKILFTAYLNNQIARRDFMELMAYIAQPSSDDELYELMLAEWRKIDDPEVFDELRNCPLN
jgi:hypothetical protein